MRPLRILLAAVLLSSLLLVTGAHPVAAANGAANCGGLSVLGAGNFHNAFTSGIYAHLDPQLLQLCLNPAGNTQRGSFSWSAIQYAGECPNCILQIGRGICDDPLNSDDCDNQGQRVYTSWGRDPSVSYCSTKSRILPTPVDRGPAPQDNGYHYYRVAISGGSFVFDHWPKGQPLVSEWSIPVGEVCWRLNAIGATFVERWNSGDALGGSDANHYQVLHVTGRTGLDPWLPSAMNANQPCASDPGGSFNPYHCDITGTQAWKAWTSR